MSFFRIRREAKTLKINRVYRFYYEVKNYINCIVYCPGGFFVSGWNSILTTSGLIILITFLCFSPHFYLNGAYALQPGWFFPFSFVNLMFMRGAIINVLNLELRERVLELFSGECLPRKELPFSSLFPALSFLFFSLLIREPLAGGAAVSTRS